MLFYFMAVLGLQCFMGYSLVRVRGAYLPAAVWGLLIAASLVVVSRL